MNKFNIKNALKTKQERNWDKIVVFVDVHGTILKPNYDGFASEFYPNAKYTMQYLSSREDVELVMYTCSTKKDIDLYLKYFQSNGIYFDNVNQSSVKTSEFASFDDKPYFNVLLEDKAGFEGENDWLSVLECFQGI